MSVEPHHPDGRTSRRQVVLGGLGALASGSLLLTACGGSGSAAEAGDASTTASTETPTTAPPETAAPLETEAQAGPWTFIDDRGETVTLPERPERVVAQEDAAAALWPLGVRPVGVFGNAPLAENPQLEGEDLSTVASVGAAFGEINLEQLVALAPDLIVVPNWEPYGASGMGFANDDQLNAVEKIAPIAAVTVTVPFAAMIDRFHELAEALGADVGAPSVIEAREALDTALEGFGAAVAANPGLRVLAVAATPDLVYVADPAGYSDLKEYVAAGLDVVVPTANIDYGWQELSWEKVDTYPADVILQDGRAGTLTPTQLNKSQPTWSVLPAVEAGQVGSWYVGTTYSLPFFTLHVNDLTALIEGARVVVG